MSKAKIRILFVCLGNICRSPMAEGLFRAKLRARGLEATIATDSCGTGGWHVNEPPDGRAQATMKAHDMDIGDLRGRQFDVQDFDSFDWIVCMDQSNYEGVRQLLKEPAHERKVVKMLSFDPDQTLQDVPDPYFGGPGGFEKVYDMLDVACERLLTTILDASGPRR